MDSKHQSPFLTDWRYLIAALDIVLLTTCSWATLAIHMDPWNALPAWSFFLAPLMALPIFVRFGLYHAFLMYLGTRAFISIAQAVTLHALLLGSLAYLVTEIPSLPAIFVTYWLLCLVLVGGSRIMIRSTLRWMARARNSPTRVAIFGAGAAGAELVEALQGSIEYEPLALLDDKSRLHGHEIRGLRIYSTLRLGELIKKFGIKEVLLAIPAAPHQRRREITRFLQGFAVQVRTVPPLSELVTGESEVKELRDLDPADVLERDCVEPQQKLLSACITDKSVMVTGAGGSIGSELCRQIVSLSPARLVLFENSEFNLYKIESELRTLISSSELSDEIQVIPLLGTILDEQHVYSVLESFQIETLYHAAAYKHVPLVEHNPIVGITNNAFGTWYCARAAVRAKIDTFTLISTDKAVRPTNVMGASKRIAEQIIQALSQEAHGTRFSIVRFGNVFASSGSVVPLFRSQIRKGGPITITHPEVTRYFMTIPEAAQLVIQASSLSGRGDVFVLDMGEPIRVIDLAKRLIALSGLTVKDSNNPNGDIAIEVISLRPGEKLHEELVIGGEVTATEHPRINRVKERFMSWTEMKEILSAIEVACTEWNTDLVTTLLKQAVAGYIQNESADLLSRARFTCPTRNLVTETSPVFSQTTQTPG